MNQNKEGTPLPRTGATTEIPGPYLTPEQTESFPLKSKPNSGKPGIVRTCCCWSCCTSLQTVGAQSTGGLRPVVACFFTFSLALTIALVLQIRLGDPQVLPHGSVASDSRECSQVGTSILRKGGNSVDAAIATSICLGVVLPHLTGIGGGGFIAIYDHRRRMVIDAIDFRETAPLKIPLGLDDVSNFGGNVGGHSVGVPGFLKGLELAHKLYGRLSWAELITPSINLCRTGFLVPSNLIMARSQLLSSASLIQLKQSNPSFWDHFESLEAGHNMIDLKMADTLQAIANEGSEAFYNGSLTDDLIEAIITSGGQLSRTDLESYSPIRRPLIRVPFGPSSWVYSMGAPSGGPLLLASLRLYEEAYAAQARESYQTTTDHMSLNITADPSLQSDIITTILKNFSVKFTPTVLPELKSTKVYVTPLPSQTTTSLKDNGEDIILENSDTLSKLKESKGVQNVKEPKSQSQNSYKILNDTEVHSLEEMGKAIVEPYKLRRKRASTESLGKGNAALDQAEEKKDDPEDEFGGIEILLKSLKGASSLYSQLGDPAFSKYPNEGYQTAVNPSLQLKTKMKMLKDGDPSKFYKLQLQRPAGSNVAVVDANELYVSIVSGLNTWFGSQVLTNGGYLLNNAVANFFDWEEQNSSSETSFPLNHAETETISLPPPVFPSVKTTSALSPQTLDKIPGTVEEHKRVFRAVNKEGINVPGDNQLSSGKRPLSESVVAFVVPRRGNEGTEGESYGNDGPESGVEPCGQRMILGSADAISAAQVLVQTVLKGLPLVKAIEATRVRPIVPPRNFGIEVGPESSKWGEESVSPGSTTPKGTPLPLPYPSVNGVQEIGDVLASHSDSRGGGVAARF